MDLEEFNLSGGAPTIWLRRSSKEADEEPGDGSSLHGGGQSSPSPTPEGNLVESRTAPSVPRDGDNTAQRSASDAVPLSVQQTQLQDESVEHAHGAELKPAAELAHGDILPTRSDVSAAVAGMRDKGVEAHESSNSIRRISKSFPTVITPSQAAAALGGPLGAEMLTGIYTGRSGTSRMLLSLHHEHAMLGENVRDMVVCRATKACTMDAIV